MRVPAQPETSLYEADIFEGWRVTRAITQPYYETVYARVGQELAAAETILDLGGGDGHTFEVLGTDFQDRLITVDPDQQALARLQETYPDAQSAKADAARLPFDDASADAAISITAYDGWASKKQARVAAEVARVLKPGGKFVVLRDLAYNLGDLAQTKLDALPPSVQARILIVPVLNRDTNNIDQLGLLPRDCLPFMEHGSQSILAKMAMEAVRPYIGHDWFESIYRNRLVTGALAKQFGILLHEMKAEFGESTNGALPEEHSLVPIDEPLAPLIDHKILTSFDRSGLTVSRTVVGTDSQTDEPLLVNEWPIRSMYIDELANILIQKFRKQETPPGATTRVHGRTPIYTATKI